MIRYFSFKFCLVSIIDPLGRVVSRTLDNVVELAGDNCSTNTLLVRRCNVRFVGCASHRCKLAMKDMIQKHVATIDEVRAVMKKLSDLSYISDKMFGEQGPY